MGNKETGYKNKWENKEHVWLGVANYIKWAVENKQNNHSIAFTVLHDVLKMNDIDIDMNMLQPLTSDWQETK